MIIPMTIECGHSFCYDCIYQWFSNKINCPTCRHDIENKPILNIHLKEICHKIIESIIENTSNGDGDSGGVDHLMNRKLECLKTYNLDVKNKSIFGDLFNNTVTTLIDCSDGVARCGNCHWEAHGSICSHCGTRFRRSTRTINGESEEDEDDENEDDEDDAFEDVVAGFRQSVEINEYDSDDSFIDSRTANEIPVGTDSDNDSEIITHTTDNNNRNNRVNGNVDDNDSNENENENVSDYDVEYVEHENGDIFPVIRNRNSDSFGNNSAIHEDWHGFESATSSVIDRAFSDDDDGVHDDDDDDDDDDDVSLEHLMNDSQDSIHLSSPEQENIIQLSGDDDDDDSYYDSEDIRDALDEMDNFNVDATDYDNNEEEQKEEEEEDDDDDVVELSDYNSYSDDMVSDVDDNNNNNDDDDDVDGWW